MTPSPLPPDDLDRAFAGFFKAELPDPFPGFVPPVAEPSSLRAARTPARSAGTAGRLTLAASVAALLAVGLWLSSGPRPDIAAQKPVKAPNGSGLLDGATANGEKLQPKLP